MLGKLPREWCLWDWAQYSAPPAGPSCRAWGPASQDGVLLGPAPRVSWSRDWRPPAQPRVNWKPRNEGRVAPEAPRETLPRGNAGCGEVGTRQRQGLVPEEAVSEGLKGHDPLGWECRRGGQSHSQHCPKHTGDGRRPRRPNDGCALPQPQGTAGSGQGCPWPRYLLLLPFLLWNRELSTSYPGQEPQQCPWSRSTFPHHLCTPITVRHCSQLPDHLPSQAPTMVWPRHNNWQPPKGPLGHPPSNTRYLTRHHHP